MNRKKLFTAVLTIALCAAMTTPAQAATNPLAAMKAQSQQAVEAAIKAGTVPPGTTIYDCVYGADKNGVTIVIEYRNKNGDWIDAQTQKKKENPPDYSKEIEAMSQWLDGLTLTSSAGTFTYYPQAGASGGAVTAAPSEFTDADLVNYADKVLELVNKEREKAGVVPLERSGYLDEAANTRAMDCASVNSLYINGVPHVRPDGSRWFTVLGIDKNYNYGENAGQGGLTADIRMASWMKSEGHRADILKEDYTEVGIGCAISGQGEIFATQIFYRP